MKSLNQFKTNTVIEEESSYSKFDILVRAGLAEKSQIQRLHKVLDKMSEDRPVLTNTEKTIVQNLLNKMVDLITNNQQIFQKAKQAVREGIVVSSDLKYNPETGRKYPAHRKNLGTDDKEKEQVQESVSDVPFILVLKRKAIRMYPDGTKVALYHNEKLNKYFSVPYSTDKNIDAAIQAEETEIVNIAFDSVRHIAESEKADYIVFNNGASYFVDVDSAKSLVSLHESLSDANKKVLEESISSGKQNYKKVVSFARENFKQ